MTRSSIAGTPTPDAAALTGRDRYRPFYRDEMRAAVRELAARGLTAHDISAALSLSLGAVRDLLGDYPPNTPGILT